MVRITTFTNRVPVTREVSHEEAEATLTSRDPDAPCSLLSYGWGPVLYTLMIPLFALLFWAIYVP